MDKSSSHSKEQEENKNHQCENNIFADESITQHQCRKIKRLPRPEQINQKAAVTMSARTSDPLGDRDDHPRSKHLNQVEILYSILYEAHIKPGDVQQASNSVHQAKKFRNSDHPRPTAKIKKRSSLRCMKESLLFTQRLCVLVCPVALAPIT
ncbi:hypothetical protein OUZ56_029901 [Daphnia magna]|uniref:Uncharacterized protein n=1 Tax=Daphnia magna TaxID=35525 RepID=A0ABR0B857_9CRUS|nr:hypothetical protein OUZ56_029901 [Daphnia magna]